MPPSMTLFYARRLENRQFGHFSIFYFRSLWISRIEEVKRKLEDEEKREEDSVSSGGIGGYGVDTDADNAMQVKSKIELLSR